MTFRHRRSLAVITAATLACGSLIAAQPAFAHDEAIAGQPSIGDPLFPGIGNTGYDVQHYDVSLNYQPGELANDGFLNGDITATTVITAVADTPLKSFSLDFEGLNVDSLKVNGEPAEFTRSEDKTIESFKLHIVPAAPVSGQFTVEVEYSGQPVTHVDHDHSWEGWVRTKDGATALGQPVGTMTWIPSNNTPSDKATFDIRVTIPNEIHGKPAAAASNGELTKTANGDGTTTWHWKQQRQQATMATMLSIGNYDVYEGEITLLDGTVIPEWTFVDPNITEKNKQVIQDRRDELQEVTQFFEKIWGKYPGGSTGMVVDITELGYALETQDRSYFERGVSHGTFVHEAVSYTHLTLPTNREV